MGLCRVVVVCQMREKGSGVDDRLILEQPSAGNTARRLQSRAVGYRVVTERLGRLLFHLWIDVSVYTNVAGLTAGQQEKLLVASGDCIHRGPGWTGRGRYLTRQQQQQKKRKNDSKSKEGEQK